MKIIFRILIGWYFVLINTIFINAEVLHLEECIDITLKNNPDLIQSRYALEHAEISVKQSFSSLFPSISASTSGSSGGAFFSDGPSEWNWSVGGSVNQQVYRPGIYTSVKLAKVQEKISTLSNEEWILRIRSAVEKLYYQILTSQVLIDVYTENIHLAEEQIRKVRTMYELGLRRESDLLKSEVQKGTFETKLINEKQNTISLKRELNLLMGHTPDQSLEILSVEPDIINLPDYKTAHQRLTESNPTLKTLKMQVRVKQLSTTIAKEAYLPTALAYYSYTRNKDSFSGEYVDRDQIGLRLSIDLFDGFDKQLNIQKQKIQIDEAKVELEAVQRELEQTLSDQYTSMETQNKLITILQKNLESAKKDLDVVLQQYAQGFASILDLMDAQVSVLESHTDLVKTQFARKILESEIRRLLNL